MAIDNQIKWNATVKAYPAISDLVAIAGVTRWQHGGGSGAGGNYDWDSPVCPADEIWIIVTITSACTTKAAGAMVHYIRDSTPTNYGINSVKPVLAGDWLISAQWYTLMSGDKIRVHFDATTAGDWLNASFVGWIIKLY